MDNGRKTVSVEVFGEFACFTRPEFKVERVSYQVITPSAARGVLESIFWKPEFRYEIRRIGVINLGTQISVMRNELDRRQVSEPLLVEECRQQRTSLILRDVAYVLEAEIVLKPYIDVPAQKYVEQFNRRVARGQYHHTPYLGTREFPAFFTTPQREPVQIDLDVGTMLFDIAFIEDDTRRELEFIRHGQRGPVPVAGFTKSLFFHAKISNGWIEVPKSKYEELYGLEGGCSHAF